MSECPPRKRVLAQGDICQVEECACGVLHVTIGALTLRLRKEATSSIVETLSDALRGLESRHALTAASDIHRILPS